MENQKPYEILENQKWQDWADDCDVRSGLMHDMCFMSGDKCRQARCIIWKLRAMILAEGMP